MASAGLREVAELFQVSLATVENARRRYRRTGDAALKTPELKPRGLLDLATRQKLARWVQEQPDVMLAELQVRLAQQCHKVQTALVPREEARRRLSEMLALRDEPVEYLSSLQGMVIQEKPY